MRLDADCVRDILLCIEENTGLRKTCFFIDTGLTDIAQWLDAVTPVPPYQEPLLNKYGNDTLIYHVHYCLDSKLAIGTSSKDEYKIQVSDLSPSGHDLLAKIRDTERWHGIKKALPAIRNYSLDAVNAVSEGMTSAAISALLRINP